MSMVHVNARPSIRTMAILSQVVSTVQGRKGSDLHNNSFHSLATLNYSGDEKGSALLQHLLLRCAAPYAGMLPSWVTQRKVQDPYTRRFHDRGNEQDVLRKLPPSSWCREREENVLFSMHESSDEDIVATLRHVLDHAPTYCVPRSG